MGIFPDFGAHAVWVWSAYAATIAILVGLGWLSWSALRRAERSDRGADPDAAPVAQAVRIDDA